MSNLRGNTHRALAIAIILITLAGCGGGNDGGPAPPSPPSSLPPMSNPDPVIGASGGTVTEVSGAMVVVPAGAFTADTTIRIARDSTGAPAIPADLTAVGSLYVITPHGGEFAEPVEVRVPAPNVTLQPNQEFKIAKAQPAGDWVVFEDTALNEGVLSTQVDSFSFFTVVVVTYMLPIAEVPPLQVTTSISCSDNQCGSLIGPVTATYTVTSNNGQSPQNCENSEFAIFSGVQLFYSYVGTGTRTPISATGGEFTRTINPSVATSYKFGVGRRCSVNGTWTRFGYSLERSVYWASSPAYPGLTLAQMPEQVDVVEGLVANVDAVLSGGAAAATDDTDRSYRAPTRTDRAIVDWERSDDNGASWRVIAHSYQDEATPLPGGVGIPWRYWGVRHGFVATATDQGALLRLHACYTPPTVAPPPCITSANTRLNVLQQSALPTIVEAPRSVLVRTGQTASLSATASGLPSPALQWQTRAANSSGEWSDVSAGIGATTANYTTAAMTLADNGVEYRVVATNAVGVMTSNGVTVSVSDLDVAPTLTTQPGNLTVTSGSDAVFAVTASGTEALGYQWSRNGTAIPGANSAVLRLTSVTTANAGAYSVTVSNDAGDADSNTAQLTVIAGTPLAVAPTIVTQPASATVNAGNTATFAIGVDGSGPFTFVWRKDGTAIPGATSAVLTLNAVSASNAGSYSVSVSNAADLTGVASSAATLTVLPNGAASLPVITTQPSTIIVASGGSGILAVAATGSGPLSYQWLADGVPISGETAAVLTLANVDANDAGSYAVSVSNNLGSVSSDLVDVILLGAPVITAHPSPVSLFENSTTTFRVEATGSGLRYQWLLNGSPLANSNAETYTTPSLTVADSGAVYSVIVFNGAGLTVSSPAVLTVQIPVPPTILQQPADVSVVAGLPANLCMAFGGTPPFSVRMNRWSGAEWMPLGSSVSITDNGVFCLPSPNLQLADNGAQFRFFASNADSGLIEAMTRTVTVTVTAPPHVTSTTIVSLTSNGVRANNRSSLPSVSADGRLIAFVTDGTNLVPGFTNPPAFGGHAYVYDLVTGIPTAINQTPTGTQSIYGVTELKIAANGRYVVFTSLAGDLVAGDTNGSLDVFVRDLQTGITERINVLPDGSQLTDVGNAIKEMNVDISADGRFVSFIDTYDMLGGGAPAARSLYLRNTQSDQTRLVASSPTAFVGFPALSADGEYMAYALTMYSPARQTIEYYDVEADSTNTLFTLDTTDGQDYLGQGVAISGNGRYVAFAARSTSILDGSPFPQVLAIDRLAPNAIIVASSGVNGHGDGASSYPKLADDGHVLFATTAPNLTGNLALSFRPVLVIRDLASSTMSVASRRPNGTNVWTALYNNHALSRDGTMLALVADDAEMTGGPPEHQVYLAPSP